LIVTLCLGLLAGFGGLFVAQGNEDSHRETCAAVADRTDQTVDEFRQCANEGVPARPAIGYPLMAAGFGAAAFGLVQLLRRKSQPKPTWSPPPTA
jgi:hypothetical protein